MPDNANALVEENDYLSLIRNHYDGVLRVGTDSYGEQQTAMWLASIDIENGGLPPAPYPAKRRVYREISAPRGSTLYWEQPAVAAAYHLSTLSGDARYARAADDYLGGFLARCVSPNDLFLWGNHCYYDVVTDEAVHFSGSAHEVRPLPCAWEMFWRISPEATESAIRRMGQQHIKNHQSGLFDRHASYSAIEPPTEAERLDPKIHSFLEAGGVLVESLCWLFQKTGDENLSELALRCARYSFSHRGEKTGLLRNQATFRRWDFDASTTEVGLWATCLLRAVKYSGLDELRDMAREAVAAWLRYGFDEKTGRYFGSVNVEDGAPSPDAGTEYAPARYADLWEPLFPTHNYPMSLAQASLTLFEQTGQELFRQAVERWAGVIAQSTPANGGQGAYADQYGRCIYFLCNAAAVFNSPQLKAQASTLAEEAVAQLYSPSAKMFRGHPGEERCDAVDGIGILFLALMYLQTGKIPDTLGFHF
jgi:hypothetical protein